MAALRKGVVYLRFVRSSGSVLLSSRKPAVSKLGKWTNILYTGVASLAVGGGLCAVPFKQVEPLSHDSLIKRAASLVTDSSSTFLSQTTLALIDAITEYSKLDEVERYTTSLHLLYNHLKMELFMDEVKEKNQAVHTLIALQKRYLASLGKLTPAEEDSIWQVIIGQRAKVNDIQEDCKHFESTWFSAMKLCEAAAEAAYTSGAEHACVTARTNIHLAQSQVEEARKLSLDADQKLAETKVMEVKRMAQYAASLENNEEEEVPEAYLRED